jgi:hypothetical protein
MTSKRKELGRRTAPAACHEVKIAIIKDNAISWEKDWCGFAMNVRISHAND